MSLETTVFAPARLHFGLLSFGHAESTGIRQYGGIGLMVAEPRVELEFVDADEFSVTGVETERVKGFALAWMAMHDHSPACEIRVHSVIPAHVGLGSGTQLAHSVASGLSHYCELGLELEPLQLVKMNGRGRRSAVGTYGFVHGGCIADGGKRSGEPLGSLRGRHEIPGAWRFVLVRPAGQQGLCGGDEAQAFGEMPAVPATVTDRLSMIMNDRLIPGCAHGDFAKFSSAVYEYGIEAGNCFGKRQRGPFASPALQELVDTIRRMGYTGVGQSSWGPTIFVVTEDQHDADQLATRLNSSEFHSQNELETIVTRGDNVGAVVQRRSISLNRRGSDFVGNHNPA